MTPDLTPEAFEAARAAEQDARAKRLTAIEQQIAERARLWYARGGGRQHDGRCPDCGGPMAVDPVTKRYKHDCPGRRRVQPPTTPPATPAALPYRDHEDDQ